MTCLTLGLGSNQQPHFHMRQALDGLQQHFGELRLSSVFESEAVGFDGSNFLNMVVLCDTTCTLAEINHIIKALEDANGRRRGGPRFAARTLDIDILTYDELYGEYEGIVLPRPEITDNAFVLWPMAQVCGSKIDPDSGLSYQQLWDAYDKSRQRLWAIDFEWQGRRVSHAAPA